MLRPRVGLLLHAHKRLGCVTLAVCVAMLAVTGIATAATSGRGIWLSSSRIASLPMSGAAWSAVKAAADGSWGTPRLSDNNSNHDAMTLAGALVYARTGTESYRTKVISALRSIVGTESGGDGVLGVSRNLVSYVIAADLVGFSESSWSSWLSALRTKALGDGKSGSIVDCHRMRPNNWGTNCGASRIAADVYLSDVGELANAVKVFRGWLGDRSQYSGFNFHELDWQADPSNPVGINRKGATIQGKNVDGVLPDDQRRAGGFTWPPPKENYVWGALGPAVVQAALLHQAGYGDAFTWSDSALRRATQWLHTVAGFPASGDNKWIPWLVNAAYGTSYPAPAKTMGKSMAWTDWTHASALPAPSSSSGTGSSSSSSSTSSPAPSESTGSGTTTTSAASGAGPTLTAVADAPVDSDAPDVNEGAGTTLRVRGGSQAKRTYLRFEVSGRSRAPSSAKLRLYVKDASEGILEVQRVTGSWSESTITWDNAPAPSGAVVASGRAQSGWIVLELGSAIGGNGSYSFVITTSSSDAAKFASRETRNAPVLVLG